MRKKNALPVLFILLAASGWGVIGVFSRPLAAAGLSSLQITLICSAVVTLAMGAFLLGKDRNLFRVHWRDFWMFLGTGLVNIVFSTSATFVPLSRPPWPPPPFSCTRPPAL